MRFSKKYIVVFATVFVIMLVGGATGFFAFGVTPIQAQKVNVPWRLITFTAPLQWTSDEGGVRVPFEYEANVQWENPDRCKIGDEKTKGDSTSLYPDGSSLKQKYTFCQDQSTSSGIFLYCEGEYARKPGKIKGTFSEEIYPDSTNPDYIWVETNLYSKDGTFLRDQVLLLREGSLTRLVGPIEACPPAK